MTKKQLLILLVLLILFSLILASYASAGCCFNQGEYFCQSVSEAECCPLTGGVCPTLYDSSSATCAGTKCESDYGCCENTCSYGPYSYCEPPNEFVLWDYECEQIDGCKKGCCIYLQDGQIMQCDDNYGAGKYKKDCIVYSPYNEIIFYNFIGSQCTNICTGGIEAPMGNISGHVSLQSGAKVSGAKVTVEGYSDYTNANGYYLIENLAPGTFQITVSEAIGWNPVSEQITIVDRQTITKNIILTDAATTGNLEGYIWNRTKGTPLRGALVSIPSEKASGDNYAYSGSNGAYTINNVYPGSISVSATATNYYSEAATIVIVAGISNSLNFTLQNRSGLTATVICGDGSVGSGEQCDDSNTANGDGCSSNCQIEVCGQNIGDCCEFDYLCPTNYLTAITNCGGTYYGCCDTACYDIQQCINGYPNDLAISQTSFDSTHPGPMCECGGNFYNTSAPLERTGYCCNSNFQTSPCTGALGRITGFAKDNKTNNGLNDATISLKSYSDLTRTGGTSSQAGFYSIDLPAGTYNLTASRAGYITNLIQNIVISSGEITNLNIFLDPLSYECTGNIPAPEVTVKNIKGTPYINITWEQPCKDSTDRLWFFIFRNGKPIGGMFSRYAKSYIDKGADLSEGSLQWDTTYTYIVNVTTTNLGTNSSSRTLSTGSILCKDKFNNEELCIDSSGGIDSDSIYRAKCDYSNTPVSFENCITSKGTKSVCVGPIDDITHCSKPIDCKMLGIPQNVFGMYYGASYPVSSPDKNCLINLTTNERNYCYYDYSPTTVDKCIDCSQKGRCYDYNSTSACTTDNCYHGATRSTNCSWTSGYFSEFGKGICYEEGYKGTDYCSLCNEKGSLFENVGCTTQLCSLLGKCYSENGNSCEACTAATTCETYYDELSCIGSSSGFEITHLSSSCSAPVGFSYSNDSCSLGKCRWINNACVKDSDADGVADCSSSNIECKKDVTAPSTTITNKPPVINSNGVNIGFEVSDYNDINKTYYCIGQGICCPDKEVLNENVTLPNNNYPLADIEGNYNISFYSIDKYKNTEKIKTETLYIDTKRPSVNYILVAVENSLSSTTSDILINLTVDEYSICRDNLKRGTSDIGSNLNRYIKVADSPHLYNYSDLADGTYYYSLTCTDMYGNENKIEKSIYLDRVYKIFNAAPVNLTTASSTVTLHLETPDMLYCEYNKSGTWIKFNPSVFGGEGIGYPSGCSSSSCTKYLYDISETSLATGTYNYESECWSQSNRQGTKMDSTNLVFTMDKQAPETTALYESSTGSYAEINENLAYYNPLIKFNCFDHELGPPSEFGCDLTKYCINSSNCAPNIDYSGPLKIFDNYQSGTYSLCYSSSDNGGNTGATECISMIIDTTGAAVAISTPSSSYVTNQEELVVDGTWSDSSGIDTIKIEWFNETNKLVRLADKTGTTSGTFNTHIDLYKGQNTIKAIAEDSVEPAPNKRETSITVYYDLIGPVISAAVYNSTSRIDHDIMTYSNGESGHNITFNLIVIDEQWCSLSNPQEDIKSVSMIIKCISDGCSSFGEKNYTLDSKGNNQYGKIIGTEENLLIGDYNVTYYAEDILGNPSSKTQIFSIVDTTPVRIELIEPSLGRVNNNKPLIKIRTDEESACDLTYAISGGTITENFATTGGFDHTFQVTQALDSEDGKNVANTLVIGCIGVFTGKTTKNYNVVVDLLNPAIHKFSSSLGLLMSSTDNSKYYLALTDEQDKTKLSIESTEEVRCKFDSAETDYSKMQNTFLDYDQWLVSLQSDWLENLEDNTSYKFNIACEDKVGWLTDNKKIELEVNYSKEVMIFDASPSGYINDPTPEISVKTVRDAECYATPLINSEDSSYSAWSFDYNTNLFSLYALMSSDSNNKHTTKIANFSSDNSAQIPLEENKAYAFNVECRDPLNNFDPGSVYIVFSTDYTLENPTITSPSYSTTNNAVVNVAGSTEPNSKLQIYINNEPKLFEPYFTSDGIFSESLTLDNGTNIIKVDVVDKAGNRNSETITVNYINEGPSVDVILPSNKGPFKSLKQIAAVLSDNGGGIDLDSSYIKLRKISDNSEISMIKMTIGNNTLIYNISSLENAVYRIDAVPIDNLGNVGDIDTALFEINNYVPGIDIESPENMKTITDVDKSALFKGTISADEAVISLNLVLNDNKISLQPAYSFETTRTLNEGKNIFYLSVNTTIGNYGESPAYYIFLDTTGPSACIDIGGELQCPATTSSESVTLTTAFRLLLNYFN